MPLSNRDRKLLTDAGWIIDCEKPLRIHNKLGHVATGTAILPIMVELSREKRVLTPKQFENKMKKVFTPNYDKEDAHIAADSLMCELLRTLGYDAGVEVFKTSFKYYS